MRLGFAVWIWHEKCWNVVVCHWEIRMSQVNKLGFLNGSDRRRKKTTAKRKPTVFADVTDEESLKLYSFSSEFVFFSLLFCNIRGSRVCLIGKRNYFRSEHSTHKVIIWQNHSTIQREKKNDRNRMTKNFVHEIHLRPRQCDWLKRFNLNGRSFEKSVSCCEMTTISGNFRIIKVYLAHSLHICFVFAWDGAHVFLRFVCVCVTWSVMHVKRCINASKHPKIICNIKFYLIISERNVE